MKWMLSLFGWFANMNELPKSVCWPKANAWLNWVPIGNICSDEFVQLNLACSVVVPRIPRKVLLQLMNRAAFATVATQHNPVTAARRTR